MPKSDTVATPGPPTIFDLFPPSKYTHHTNVVIFDEHESQGVGGKPKKVTPDDLQRYANTRNKKFYEENIATPFTLGHTKDGEEVKEEDQPDTAAWGVNLYVGKLPYVRSEKKYLIAKDAFVKKQYGDVFTDYPHRSIELWKSRDDIHPIALLKKTPERELPPVKYEAATEECYKYLFTAPSPSLMDNSMDDKDKAIDAAQQQETSSAKGVEAQVAELTEKVNEMQQMWMQLMEMLHEGDDDKDLLAPADEDGGEEETEDDGKKPESEKKKEPVKMEASAGPTNTFVPTNEDKKKMSREDEATEKVKYERLIAEAVAQNTESIRKDYEDMRAKYNRSEAEKMIATLEKNSRIDFGDEKEKEAETQLFANLLREDRTGTSFQVHAERVAKKYKRLPDQKPDSEGANSVLKFARTDDSGSQFKSADDVIAFTNALGQNPKLTREDWAKQRATKQVS